MRKRSPSRRWPASLLLAAVALACPTLGTRLVDGHAALQWTRYYAAQGAEARIWDVGNRAGRSAARAIERTAPLPQAAEAARLALELGRGLEPDAPAAAAALYAHVRGALDGVQAVPLRGLGLAGLAREIRGREEAARSRASSPTTAR